MTLSLGLLTREEQTFVVYMWYRISEIYDDVYYLNEKLCIVP
jgi:hypothetical protein